MNQHVARVSNSVPTTEPRARHAQAASTQAPYTVAIRSQVRHSAVAQASHRPGAERGDFDMLPYLRHRHGTPQGIKSWMLIRFGSTLAGGDAGTHVTGYAIFS